MPSFAKPSNASVGKRNPCQNVPRIDLERVDKMDIDR
jgi:hypothetical protein